MLPVLFVGHGSPMNAIEENEFTLGWKETAKHLPRPKAILVISAHWVTNGTRITAEQHPKTIHDFYGFPEKLNQMQYPAPGSPDIAHNIAKTITSTKIQPDTSWGLDHGTWSVLVHMYPRADIPVLQLSIDEKITPEQVYNLGKELQQLRKDILIIGAGNIVHNLGLMNPGIESYPWAVIFDQYVRSSVADHPENAVNYAQHPFAKLAQPTSEHYLPLIYALGAAGNSKPEFFNQKLVMGSVSMTCVLWK